MNVPVKVSVKLILMFFMLFSWGCSENEEASFVNATYAPITSTLTGSIPLQITVTGHYSDESTQDLSSDLIWSSSDESIATVSSTGLITPTDSDGEVIITYTSKDSLPDGSAIFSEEIHYQSRSAVLKSMRISPTDSSIFVGEQLSFSAVGVFETASSGDESVVITNECDWVSGDSSLVRIENEKATGLSSGDTFVRASYKDESNISAQTDITVKESSYNAITIISEKNSFNVGETLQFEAIGTTSASSEIVITDTVTWSSSNVNKVTLNAQGLARALATGDDIKITASADGLQGTTKVNVKRKDYLQLFDLDEQKQLDFPYYAEYHTDKKENIAQPAAGDTLATFGLVAVGRRFTITDIRYSDFNNTVIENIVFLDANGDRIREGTIILKDETLELNLIYNNVNTFAKTLRFSFSVESESVESFVATFEIQ